MKSVTAFSAAFLGLLLAGYSTPNACAAEAGQAPSTPAAAALEKQNVVIALIGDSTVADQGGWGKAFPGRFRAGVKVLNFAENGRSSKSWYDEKRLPAVLKAKPDYVLIQFGHNDQPGKGPERETDPATTYRDYLKLYVNEFRKIGAKPILVSSVTRRTFDKNGKIKSSLTPYAEAAKAVAEEMNVPFIDLHTASVNYCNKIGPEASRAFNATEKDGTHFNQKGAEAMTDLIVNEIKSGHMELAKYLKEEGGKSGGVKWVGGVGNSLSQPAEFYGSKEAVRIAETVLLYQRNNGGWPKNYDRAANLSEGDRKNLLGQKNQGDTMFDNGSTHSEVRYLAKVYNATKDERYKEAFLRGVEFILKAQYKNGGWPQAYPNAGGYAKYITFNDGAMIGVMTALRDIAQDKAAYPFVDDTLRARCEAAVAKGVECILKCQIKVDGKRTAWCAQHDENSFAPQKARSYELASLSGAESVDVVRFLMAIDKPSPEVIEAVQGAVAWFDKAKLAGIKEIRKEDKSAPLGWDKAVVNDPAAPPMWARFYEIGTNKPIFCSRDGVPKATLAEISYERRTGYSWLGYYAAGLLSKDYPAWQKKWAPNDNVLRGGS